MGHMLPPQKPCTNSGMLACSLTPPPSMKFKACCDLFCPAARQQCRQGKEAGRQQDRKQEGLPPAC